MALLAPPRLGGSPAAVLRGWSPMPGVSAGTAVFASAALAGFLSAAFPYDLLRPQLTIAAMIVAVPVLVVALGGVRRRATGLLAAVMGGYYVAVLLVVVGDGRNNGELLILGAIPVVWSVLYAPMRLSVVSVALTLVTLIVRAPIDGLQTHEVIQFLVLWGSVGGATVVTARGVRRALETELERQAEALRHAAAASRAADELYATFDVDEVLQSGVRHVAELMADRSDSDARAYFFRVDGRRATLAASHRPATRSALQTGSEEVPLSIDLEEARGFYDAISPRHGVTVLERSADDLPELAALLDVLDIRSAMTCPLRLGATVTGILIVGSNDRPRGYGSLEAHRLQRLAEGIEVALHRARVHEADVATDTLTGLASRHEFERRLATMSGRPNHALLAIDVDGLKPVNDTQGHAAGDELLRSVGVALQASIRHGDMAARLGGDEFCVILAETDAERAAIVAQRILARLAAVTVGGRQPSVSIGIAALSGTVAAQRCLAAADRACYAAKRAGGNRYRLQDTCDMCNPHDPLSVVATRACPSTLSAAR